mmetsp:Transcript_23471/g.55609  ORF Transcript_23471/g.55609 Transcript_23471/m.55609 type:complete len:507 (-) Transcript_23471:294-1814(-)
MRDCVSRRRRRPFLRWIFPSAAVLGVLVSLTSFVIHYKNGGGNDDNNFRPAAVGKKIRKKNDGGININAVDDGPVDDTWLNETIQSISKPWIPKTNMDWCVVDRRGSGSSSSSSSSSSKRTAGVEDKGEDYEKDRGLWFVKNYKAASSTGAGITARIAHTSVAAVDAVDDNKSRISTLTDGMIDTSNNSTAATTEQSKTAMPPHCIYHASHDFADSGRHKQLHSRDKEHSFMWTIVRHPVERVLSGYSYFRAAPGRADRTLNLDEELMMYASPERSAQVRLLDTSPNSWTTSSSMSSGADKENKDSSVSLDTGRIDPSTAARIIHGSIMESYDFIGVQDRMEESLAVLKLLLDLDDSWDVVVLPSKRSRGGGDGSPSYTRSPTGKCIKLFPLELNYTLQSSTIHFFDNDFLDVQNNHDVLLYKAANRALDLTIEQIGRTVVQNESDRQQRMIKLAYDVCLRNAKFPCSSEGKLQLGLSKDSCYHEDWGCGFHCVDELKRRHGDLNN